MELKEGLLGDVPMLMASGSVDQDTCAVLQAALSRLTAARHNIVFLDLSEATQMDEAGLAVLLVWVKALRGKGWLGVIAPNDVIRRLMEDGGLIGDPNVLVFKDQQAGLVVTRERQST